MKERHGLILILFTLIHCSNRGGDVKFLFYNAKGELVDEIGVKDIKHVDWDDQCYFFYDSKTREIRKLNLSRGRIDLIFRDQILASSDGVDVNSNEIPNGFIFFCSVNGELAMDNGALCFKKLRGASEEVLNNSRYRDFLEKMNLLRR